MGRNNKRIPILQKKLFMEWDTARNGGIPLDHYSKGVHIVGHWICSECGEPFDARISDRARNGHPTGCPYCAGRKPRIGKNDLATLFPDLMRQWDYDKNIGINPRELTRGSKKRVHWRCDKEGCGFRWETPVYTRTKDKNPSGCPACSGRVAIPGKNDLATVRPDLLEEWDFDKNIGISPSMTTVYSHKKIYWLCREFHHSFYSSVYNRTDKKQPTGCPYCEHRKVLPGFNDFETVFPETAKQWDVELNKGLTARDVMPYSNTKVWFRCRCGNPVFVLISNFVIGNYSCEECKSKK